MRLGGFLFQQGADDFHAPLAARDSHPDFAADTSSAVNPSLMARSISSLNAVSTFATFCGAAIAINRKFPFFSCDAAVKFENTP